MDGAIFGEICFVYFVFWIFCPGTQRVGCKHTLKKVLLKIMFESFNLLLSDVSGRHSWQTPLLEEDLHII